MKKRTWAKRIIIFVFMILVLGLVSKKEVYAAPLDEILDYTIKVDPRTDGTLDITYNITWKVLDSEKEGPLEWVKIGTPNKHFEILEEYSDNIGKISEYNEGGTYVRIDFKEKYEAGEIVRFYYTIHQSRMYIIDKNKHICRYSFTPGWFDEIEVDHTAILWNSKNIINVNTTKQQDGYMIWEAELEEGERINASIEYNLDVFSVSEDGQAEEDELSIAVVIVVILVVCLLVVLLWHYL